MMKLIQSSLLVGGLLLILAGTLLLSGEVFAGAYDLQPGNGVHDSAGADWTGASRKPRHGAMPATSLRACHWTGCAATA